MQFGFRKEHTTYMALLTSIDKIISALENQEFTVAIFLDFSKAFDTVNHDILIGKLEKYGVRGKANEWIKDYLSNRQQYCTFNGTKSRTETITCGVPQGSILGPLLFLLYINDLGYISEKLTAIMFADDSNIFVSHKDPKILEQNINKELQHIVNWLNSNRLSLNILKTHYMVFSPKKHKSSPDLKLEINGITISEVKECKFLGVIMDNNLTWKAHIMYISTKISKSIGIISKTRKYVNQNTLLSMYYCFIYPYLLYCCQIWGNACDSTLWPILRSQKRAIRLVFNIRRRNSTSKHFKEHRILRIKEIYKYLVSLFVYKFRNKGLPDLFKDYYVTCNSLHMHATRQSNVLRIPIYKSNIGNKCIKVSGVKIWNDISKTVECNVKLRLFKKSIITDLCKDY